ANLAQSARNFAATCLADFDDYSLASQLDQPGPGKTLAADYTNTSKWLMWDDPLIGLCAPFQEVESYRPAYQKLAEELEKRLGDSRFSQRLKFPAQIARVLAIKCDLRKNLVRAYRAGDSEKLRNFLVSEVKPLISELEKLWQMHREM